MGEEVFARRAQVSANQPDLNTETTLNIINSFYGDRQINTAPTTLGAALMAFRVTLNGDPPSPLSLAVLLSRALTAIITSIVQADFEVIHPLTKDFGNIVAVQGMDTFLKTYIYKYLEYLRLFEELTIPLSPLYTSWEEVFQTYVHRGTPLDEPE